MSGMMGPCPGCANPIDINDPVVKQHVAYVRALRARLEAAERVVEAARAYYSDGPGSSGQVIDAIDAYDALRARGGDR